jgi:hypothetical protein
MPDERKHTLDPAALAALLSKLDSVMAEAQRLRKEITRQLSEQRADQQQTLSQPSRRKRSPRKR